MNALTSAPSIAATSAHGWRSHWTLLLLLLMYSMSFADRQLISVLVEPIKDAFHVSDTLMGLLGGMSFALFFSLLAIPAGRYADRANRRNFISYCCGFWSLMTIACAAATGYWWLFLGRIGVAVGEAGGDAPGMALIASHYSPKVRARAMSVYFLGPPLGIMIGLVVGGWIATHFGWRYAFAWMSVPGIVVAVLLRLTGSEARRDRWEGEPASRDPGSLRIVLREMWGSVAFRRVMVSGVLLMFAGYGIGMWTPAFFMRSYGYSAEAAGATLGFIGGPAAVIGTLLGGWLADKCAVRDRRWRIGIPLVGALLSLPLLLTVYNLPPSAVLTLGGHKLPLAFVFYAVFATVTVFWTGPIFSAMTELAGPYRVATTMAVFNLTGILIGAGLGPLAIGALSSGLATNIGDVQSLRWALTLVGGVSYALAIVALIRCLKPYRRIQQKLLVAEM